MPEKKILIFAGKDVGYGVLSFLLKTRAPVGRVVASGPRDVRIRKLARRHRIPVDVYNTRTQARLKKARKRYAWLINAWSGAILKPATLALADRRLNLHPGFLPLCRGNDNAAWTIRRGFPAGVALVEMTRRVDAGAVYVQKRLPIRFPVRGRELHERLKTECVRLFKSHWRAIYGKRLKPRPQKGRSSSFKRRQTEADRVLGPGTKLALDDFLKWGLAHDFWPRTTAEVRYPHGTYRVRVRLDKKPR